MRSESIISLLRVGFGVLAVVSGLSFLGLFFYTVTWKLPTYPEGGNFPAYFFALSTPLSGWQDDRLKIRSNESPLDFATRATSNINSATYHCQKVYETSWASKLLSGFDTLYFRQFGVLSAKHFKCGWCHQRAYILDRALRHAKIDSELRGLDGHVVTMFRIDGVTYIADPDYGVGPFSIDPKNEEQMSVVADKQYAALWEKLRVLRPGRNKGHYDTVSSAYKNVNNDGPYMTASFLDDLSDKQEKFLDLAEKAKYLALFIGLALTYFGARILVMSVKRT